MTHIAAELPSSRRIRLLAASLIATLILCVVPSFARAATLRFEQDSAGMAYTSGWDAGVSPRLSAGTQAHTELPGRRMGFAFRGTALTVLANKAPSFGVMRVTVDGVSRDATLTMSSTLLSVPVLVVSGLTDTTHTVLIENRGGGFVSVDAFDINGSAPNVAAGPGVAEPTTAFAEADASAVARSSAWTRVALGGYRDGDYHHTPRAGEVLTFRFTGTSVAWIGRSGPVLGKSDVRVDGQLVATVDQIASAWSGPRVIWSLGGLSATSHTVEIVTRDDASSGRATRGAIVDGFEVQGTLGTPPAYTRLEEGNANIKYAGSWRDVTMSDLSGGSYRYSNQAGSGFAVAFNGTGIRWISPRFGWCGQFEVFIDGIASGTYSADSSTFIFGAPVYENRSLTPGAHRIEFRVLGTSTRIATGVTIGLDAIDVFGTPTSTTAPLAYNYVEENDDRVVASGGWVRVEEPAASGFGHYATQVSGASLRADFDGTAVRVIGPRAPGMGSLQVIIDGVSRGTVSQAHTKSVVRNTLFRTSGLTPGRHTIELRAASADGMTVAVDVIEAVGTFVQAPRPAGWARVESGTSLIARLGPWSSVTSAVSSGGSTLRTRDARARMAVRFTGTGMTVVGGRGPDLGVAEVLVDGVSRGHVDLYDPVRRDRCVLYRVDGLAAGQHDVVLRVSGRWVKPSLSYYVEVDAVDVVGTAGVGFAPSDASDYRGVFSAGWIEGGDPGVYLGGYRRSATVGSWAQYRFQGTRFELVGPKTNSYGMSTVIVDGKVVGTIDQYASSLATKQVLFSYGGLASGQHVVRVVVAGTKHAASSGFMVGVDDVRTDGDLIAQTAAQRARTTIVSTAIAQLGKPYKWGAIGPSSFDCSGLIYYSYRAAGITPPRTSRYQWSSCSPKYLTLAGMIPGDLVFLDDASYIHHVGMYVGDGVTIHAPQTGRNVEYRDFDGWGVKGRLPAAYWPK